MKLSNFFPLIALCAVTLFSACGSDGDAVRDAATENAGGGQSEAAPPTAATPNVTPTPTPEPPQNAEGIWHYTCSKGCEGGAGTATACAKCGSTLAHNAAYHGNATPPAQTSPNVTPVPSANTPPPTPEPAQNAAGVWHYTCSAGCAGGAGTATACAKCGNTLAHNAAYHK